MKNVTYNRNLYINSIKRWFEKPVIKILTGMRRVGKSCLMLQIIEHLKSEGVKEDQIVYINMEQLDFDSIQTYKDLAEHVKLITNATRGRRYLFIDEVQEIEGWEKAINSFFSEGNWDIFLTGSNANMLSSELATLLAGRYIEIPIYSLSFSEYLEFNKKENPDKQLVLYQYLRYGGLPAIHQFDLNEDTIMQYIGSVFDTIVLKDIVQRHDIRNVPLFENISRYVFDNIGNIFSARRVSAYLKSQQLTVSVDTVQKYLGYLVETFTLYKVRRYDIKGKRHLEINKKYYVGDIALRNACLGYSESAISGLMENVVFLELKRRGYEVSIGKLGEKEIDFIAIKEGKKIYIQVCYVLSDDKVVEREFSVLQEISDNYPKIVISTDTLWGDEYEGIQRINIIDFLTQANEVLGS